MLTIQSITLPALACNGGKKLNISFISYKYYKIKQNEKNIHLST